MHTTTPNEKHLLDIWDSGDAQTLELQIPNWAGHAEPVVHQGPPYKSIIKLITIHKYIKFIITFVNNRKAPVPSNSSF